MVFREGFPSPHTIKFFNGEFFNNFILLSNFQVQNLDVAEFQTSSQNFSRELHNFDMSIRIANT